MNKVTISANGKTVTIEQSEPIKPGDVATILATMTQEESVPVQPYNPYGPNLNPTDWTYPFWPQDSIICGSEASTVVGNVASTGFTTTVQAAPNGLVSGASFTVN